MERKDVPHSLTHWYQGDVASAGLCLLVIASL